MNFRTFNPSVNTLTEICNYFGITLCEFFDDENSYPTAARRINQELLRLYGDHYEKLPDFLSQLSVEDIHNIERLAKAITQWK